MKTYVYCHKYKNNLYDDIAVVRANSKEEAASILSEFYTDITDCILEEISFKTDFQKENNIKILTDY